MFWRKKKELSPRDKVLALVATIPAEDWGKGFGSTTESGFEAVVNLPGVKVTLSSDGIDIQPGISVDGGSFFYHDWVTKNLWRDIQQVRSAKNRTKAADMLEKALAARAN